MIPAGSRCECIHLAERHRGHWLPSDPSCCPSIRAACEVLGCPCPAFIPAGVLSLLELLERPQGPGVGPSGATVQPGDELPPAAINRRLRRYVQRPRAQ